MMEAAKNFQPDDWAVTLHRPSRRSVLVRTIDLDRPWRANHEDLLALIA